MRTLLLFAAFLAGHCFAAGGDDSGVQRDGSVATAVLGAPPHDLDPDPAFGAGYVTVDMSAASSDSDRARRVFPAAGGGYWLAGEQGPFGGPMQAAIAKLTELGTLNTSYNGTGKNWVPTPFRSIRDVAIGPDGELYFTGHYLAVAPDDFDFAVVCVGVLGTPCAGFGNAGLATVSFDLGGNIGDRAERIIAASGGLYVAGACESGAAGSGNTALCVARLNAATGALDNGFGNGGRYTRELDFAENGRDVINDLIVYSPGGTQVRLVMVGDTQRGPTDVDGFITSIDGTTGADETLFGPDGFAIVAIDLGTGMQDSLNRVMRRANGRFVAAGTATDDSQTPGEIHMVLAGYRADGSTDAHFGQNGRVNTTVYSRINTPFGLAERPGNRDIVVGLNVLDDLGDGHPLIAFAQFGRSGRQRHAGVFVDPPSAAGVTRMSSGTSLIFDMGRIVSSVCGCGARHRPTWTWSWPGSAPPTACSPASSAMRARTRRRSRFSTPGRRTASAGRNGPPPVQASVARHRDEPIEIPPWCTSRPRTS